MHNGKLQQRLPLTPAKVVGAGEHKVVVAHGWLGGSESWGPTWGTLDTETFTYAFLDGRGYGHAQGVGGEYTVQEFGDDLIYTCDELGWEQFSLIGHSMGGMAVQWALAQAPHRVRKIVGVTPVPASGTPMGPDRMSLFQSAVADVRSRQTILDNTTGKRLSETWLRAEAQRSMESSNPHALDGYLHSWTNTDFHELVKGQSVSAKVFVGEHDPSITTARVADTWGCWYPNLDVEVLTNAGHYPMSETPIALVTGIERFLAI
jgi:pimeloyl-ACP methyl ester carboxylesterase